MSAEDPIVHWLDSLPEACDFLPQPCPSSPGKFELGKRKQHQHQQLSPPSSKGARMDQSRNPKRQRTGDPDETPRAPFQAYRTYVSSGTSSAPGSAAPSEHSSGVSQTSSPKKKLMALNLDDEGLECRKLDAETIPPAPGPLASRVQEIAEGMDILPHTQRAILFQDKYVPEKKRRMWRIQFKEPDDIDSLPGRIPTPEEVALICQDAAECDYSEHEEASWNVEVHHPLLKAVFREGGKPVDGLFNFTTCTTARPHKDFVPKSSRMKMVHFCVYDHRSGDEAVRRALAQCTPTLSVNHTDFRPLQGRPIVLSIETKRLGENLDNAKLQMGVWHAATWKFLSSIIKMIAEEQSQTRASEDPVDHLQNENLADLALQELGFLPGIIIQGHDWRFVCSTLEKKKTILWLGKQFGTTEDLLGTYKIVAGLREIAAWVRDVYLPWFEAKVLSAFRVESLATENPPAERQSSG